MTRDISHGWHLQRDGSMWMAVGPRYLDLVQTEAGFGPTHEAARDQLAAKYAALPGIQIEVPPVSDFTIWPDDDEGGEAAGRDPVLFG